MDFEVIANLAYKESQMPNKANNLELLIYYMLKDLYNRHYKGEMDSEQGKKAKDKIEAYYVEQLRLLDFNKELMNKITNNIKTAEDDVCKITKMINAKENPENILKVALNCISKLVSDDTFKNMYNNV